MSEDRQNRIDVVVKEVVEFIPENTKFNKRLNLIVEFGSMFISGEQYRIKLTEGIEGNGYNESQLKRTLTELENQTGIELDIPKAEEISLDTVKKEIEKIVDETITVYKSYGTVKDDEGAEREIVYYSLFESSEGLEFSNAKISDLFSKHPELKQHGKVFVAELSAIIPDIHDVNFVNQKPVPVKYPEGSDDLKGFANLIYKELERDGGDFAKELQKKLADYMGRKEPATFTGIVQTIGVWSDNSYDADKLAKSTVLMLKDFLTLNSSSHVPMGDVRYTFSFPEEDEIYQTKREATSYFKTSTPEDWKARFHPDDVSVYDFMNLVLPIEQIGALTPDDAKELKTMNNAYSITAKLGEIIKRENLNGKFKIMIEKGGFSHVVFLGLTKEEVKNMSETPTTQTTQATATDNPFSDVNDTDFTESTVADDIADDDLPF